MLVNESHEQHPHLDCTVEDDNDLIITPSNSERTSSSVSYNSMDDSEAGQNQKDSLMTQGQEDIKRLGGQIRASSGAKRPSIAQDTPTWMSLEDISKTIATRCCSATYLQGGWCFSRALHALRFSVSTARKCMREKNAAQLGARNTPVRLRWCLNDSG